MIARTGMLLKDTVNDPEVAATLVREAIIEPT
jgi:hypothetical protein